jgi:DNA-binding PadR family transcriptional regulator
MDIAREFLLGFIKIHLLYHANKESFCGIDMMGELKRHGYSVGPGTLYPILHKLEEGGYLEGKKRNEDGKMRIYYKATAKGKLALRRIKPKIDELVSEITENKK